jgi:hypothetical protein
MDLSLSVLKEALLVGKDALTFIMLFVSCYTSVAAHKRVKAGEKQ